METLKIAAREIKLYIKDSLDRKSLLLYKGDVVMFLGEHVVFGYDDFYRVLTKHGISYVYYSPFAGAWE